MSSESCGHALTVVVGADLQSFVSPHEDSRRILFSVPENFNLASSPLLPLMRLFGFVVSKQFGSPDREGTLSYAGEDVTAEL